jgi:hypothetical protein
LCSYITRDLTEDEWYTYVDDELKYEKTCQSVPDKKK